MSPILWHPQRDQWLAQNDSDYSAHFKKGDKLRAVEPHVTPISETEKADEAEAEQPKGKVEDQEEDEEEDEKWGEWGAVHYKRDCTPEVMEDADERPEAKSADVPPPGRRNAGAVGEERGAADVAGADPHTREQEQEIDMIPRTVRTPSRSRSPKRENKYITMRRSQLYRVIAGVERTKLATNYAIQLFENATSAFQEERIAINEAACDIESTRLATHIDWTRVAKLRLDKLRLSL